MPPEPVVVPAGSARAPGEPCANCGSDVIGPYCHSCGQQRATGDDLTVGHFAARVVEEIEHLDSKTLRSLRGLIRPGFMTSEYVSGRRQRYLTPIKLYVICAAIFFLAAPLVGFNHDTLRLMDPASPLAPLVQRVMAASELDTARFLDRFDARFQTIYTVGLSISMLGAALLLKVLFRTQRRPYGVHQVFAMHWVAFLYLCTIFLMAIQRLTGISPVTMLALGYVVFLPYMTLAMRQVYGASAASAVVKAIAILATVYVLDSLVTIGIIMVTLATL